MTQLLMFIVHRIINADENDAPPLPPLQKPSCETGPGKGSWLSARK